jgi:hypothetical protein
MDLLRVTEENHENGQSPSRYSHPESPEYKAELVTAAKQLC